MTRFHRKSHDGRTAHVTSIDRALVSAQGFQHAARSVTKGFRSGLVSLLILKLRILQSCKGSRPRITSSLRQLISSKMKTSPFDRARECRQSSTAVCFPCSMLASCIFCHLRLGCAAKIGNPLWSSSYRTCSRGRDFVDVLSQVWVSTASSQPMTAV